LAREGFRREEEGRDEEVQNCGDVNDERKKKGTYLSVRIGEKRKKSNSELPINFWAGAQGGGLQRENTGGSLGLSPLVVRGRSLATRSDKRERALQRH